MADDGTQHGFLVALTERTMGDQLRSAAATAARTLSMTDVSDFDEAGGWVLVNGVLYAYDTVNMDADTIHLTSGLTGAAQAGDRVDLWDTDNLLPVSERVALVSVDDQDGDPVSATIDHSLAPLLAQGTLQAGQSVTMSQDPDSDEWVLSQVHAKSNPAVEVSRAASIYSGAGAPTFAANKGDIYIRTDTPGTTNQRIYMNTALGSSWAGVV